VIGGLTARAKICSERGRHPRTSVATPQRVAATQAKTVTLQLQECATRAWDDAHFFAQRSLEPKRMLAAFMMRHVPESAISPADS
jgi:hypothetical protein